MKNFFLKICFILISFTTFAQTNEDPNKTPYSTIYNHLRYLQHDEYHPELAAASLPPGTKDAEHKAIILKQILDGKGLFVDLALISRDVMYKDSVTQKHIYFISYQEEPSIYVEKIGENWYYSASTISNLDRMYKDLFPFGETFLNYFSASFWHIRVLGLETWKWFTFLLIICLAVLVYWFFHFVSKWFTNKILKPRIDINTKVKKKIFRFSRVVGMLVAVNFLIAAIPVLHLVPQLNFFLFKGLNVAIYLLLTILFSTIVLFIFMAFEKVSKRTSSMMDDQLVPVLRRLSLMFVWIIGSIYILDYLKVNITALLAGISIGGLALALAAQDTVKNLLGSLMIFIDRPFQIGDWIHFKGVDGTVEEVGMRSTRIRTFADSLTYVPNALLADAVVDNMGLRKYRRYNTTLGITYDTPPEKIEAFVEGVRKIILLHPKTRKDAFEVHLNNFSASSIDILLYTFFEAKNWTEELTAKHELMLAIIRLANKLGVSFAFPTQTIHLEKNETSSIMENRKPQEEDTFFQEIEEYFNRK